MGGVLSLTIFLIIIFAALFTNSFIKQYPDETSQAPEFSCDQTLRNSQFSSQMQSLGAVVSDSAKTIFNLLQSQQYTLTVTLLNTIVGTNITVEETVGTITKQLQTVLSAPVNGCLVISSNLTENIATININISGSQAIGGVRIGLSAPAIVDQNSVANELYFANSYTMTNRTMSQDPYFNIELIQVINETKPLSINNVSQYSGLWIPTFIMDNDQNFYTQTEYDQYHTNLYTILTIDITQATYYVYNIEKPIIKTTGVIFKNILFASMCLEIFGFAFLIFKLIIIPFIRLIIRLVWSKKEEKEESKEENDDNDSDDDETKKTEEHKSDDDDDDDEIPQKIKLEPGKNEWYMPDIKI